MVEKSEKGKKPAPKEPQERSARSQFGRSDRLPDKLKALAEATRAAYDDHMAWETLADLVRDHDLKAMFEVDTNAKELVLRIQLTGQDASADSEISEKKNVLRIPVDALSKIFGPSKKAKIWFQHEETPFGTKELVIRIALPDSDTAENVLQEVGAMRPYGIYKKPPIFGSLILTEDRSLDAIEIVANDITARQLEAAKAVDPSKRRIDWLKLEAEAGKDQKKGPDKE